MPSILFTFSPTAGDDFLLGRDTSVLNGGDGDDYILGDVGSTFSTGTSVLPENPAIIDASSVWTTDENPFFGDASISHTSLYVLADAGQTHYSRVTVGAGETITIDIDFGNHVIGSESDIVVELYNSSGILVATGHDSSFSQGGHGSTLHYDSLLTFTHTGGTAESYTIRFREFGGDGTFEGGETFVANISVTGHAVGTNTAMGDDSLHGGNGNDTIAGQGGNDSLFGDDGDDTLLGGSGADLLDGGAGSDVMYGGSGNDTYVVDSDFDEVVDNAFEGTDLVQSSVSYVLPSNVEHLTLTGTQAINGIGNSLDNQLAGNSAANILMGFNGNDVIDGGAGADTLYGGGGNDHLDGGYQADVLHGEGGDDALVGGNGHDTLYGGDGADVLRGGRANDHLYGGNGNDDLDGGLNQDVLYGEAGNDTLVGGNGHDTLYGGANDDLLKGGRGNDVLEGGAGRDIMFGGLEADTFVFRDGDFAGLTPSTSDRIEDFSQAEGDTIDLALVDADSLVGGAQAFNFIGTGGFNNVAGELRYEIVSGSTYVYGDTDGDGVADFMIRLVGTHALTEGDFVI